MRLGAGGMISISDPLVTDPKHGLPVRIEDVPPGWLETLADWAVIAAVGVGFLGTMLTLLVMRILDSRAEPSVHVRAARDESKVYVRITNNGRMAAEVHKVYLGVPAPKPVDPHGDQNFRLRPDVTAETFTPHLFAGKTSELVVMDWPTGQIDCWERDAAGNVFLNQNIDKRRVRVIVRVYDGFRDAGIKIEARPPDS
ncbi:hypothetical protein [Streptomyces canus]|uniref:hypothetical protein n=1 Tax=Streptomyces canus TaxID=58343 RepID=UPI002256B0A0|nr:hypothetical protein [Streptomyces canus]MCX4856641.1 hypothetical protein [Streptomyces canus]